jgi:plasmid stability protein
MEGYVHLHRYPTIDASVENEVRERLSKALSGDGVPEERTAALATLVAAVRMEPTLGLSVEETLEAHNQLEKIGGGAGFTGSVSLEESTIRPSVALVIAALAKAIQQALGTPRPATPAS